ncbi:FliH/SctL family protein [Acidisoma sp. 7E03]
MSFILVRKIPDAPVPTATEEEAAASAALAREMDDRVREAVAAMRSAAEAEGRAAGEAQARVAAEAARIERETAVAAAVSALSAATAELTAPLARKEQELAALVTELAFLLAAHVVRQEVTLRSDSVQALVADLLEEATRERHAGQTIIVRLHPRDHATIAPQFDLPQVHLLADSQIERGGTLVELLTQDGDPIDKVEWDAQLGSRIETLRRTLLGSEDEPAMDLPPATRRPPMTPTMAAERTEAA